ncbi:hypothetical protein GOBAR_AA17115 [Gossypium barbadense]|uniref:Anaphase-promoting complex subunit 4 WD40 domain-containing protein n=1 Tax=Gossypium barbadense TaxID=3634 RepID=A0A2P5XJP3_GOSBA|nr:hypothetical protein GOBAR_AA17115 [Gossypium barbadense]
MDYDYAHYMLTEGSKIKENQTVFPPVRDAYRMQLAEALNMNRTRILALRTSHQHLLNSSLPTTQLLLLTQRNLRSVEDTFPSSERTFDVPDLMDDFYLNLLDWLRTLKGCHRSIVGSMVWNSHILTIGGMDDASDSSTSELVTIDDENGPVTSVSWAPDGWYIAIGLNNSEVQLRDSASNRHSGQQLASGSNDNFVHIWDTSKASSNSPTQWIHRLEDHTYGIWDMSKAQELATEKADIVIRSLQYLPQSDFQLRLEDIVMFNLERID